MPRSTGTTFRKSVQRVKVSNHDPVAVGDRVRVLATGGGAGMIEEVIARAGGTFARRDPQAGQGTLRSVVGLEQLVVVLAAREPTPHLGLLDRFLVTAEAEELRAVICINKIDLGIPPWLEEPLAVYGALGYPVIRTSIASTIGLDELRAHLAGRTSAFLGPSGVGKSSLLNALQPDLHERVSAVSETTRKGRHTTTGTRLFPLDGAAGGSIADTAGIRALSLHADVLENLDHCFPEFRPYLGQCALRDCSHLHEPGCASALRWRPARSPAPDMPATVASCAARAIWPSRRRAMSPTSGGAASPTAMLGRPNLPARFPVSPGKKERRGAID